MHIVDIYPTKGRDRTTPLKPYKAGNIWDMPYKCCVLYFLDLSLKRSFFHRNAFFLKKYIQIEDDYRSVSYTLSYMFSQTTVREI